MRKAVELFTISEADQYKFSNDLAEKFKAGFEIQDSGLLVTPYSSHLWWAVMVRYEEVPHVGYERI